MSRARIAITALTLLLGSAHTAYADGINTELMVPYTGIGAEFGWLGTRKKVVRPLAKIQLILQLLCMAIIFRTETQKSF